MISVKQERVVIKKERKSSLYSKQVWLSYTTDVIQCRSPFRSPSPPPHLLPLMYSRRGRWRPTPMDYKLGIHDFENLRVPPSVLVTAFSIQQACFCMLQRFRNRNRVHCGLVPTQLGEWRHAFDATYIRVRASMGRRWLQNDYGLLANLI